MKEFFELTHIEYMDQEPQAENAPIENQPPLQGNQDSDEDRNEIIKGK